MLDKRQIQIPSLEHRRDGSARPGGPDLTHLFRRLWQIKYGEGVAYPGLRKRSLVSVGIQHDFNLGTARHGRGSARPGD